MIILENLKGKLAKLTRDPSFYGKPPRRPGFGEIILILHCWNDRNNDFVFTKCLYKDTIIWIWTRDDFPCWILLEP